MKIRVVSDGTTKGTKVFLPDGTEIAEGAYAVQVNFGGDDPPHVVITYLLGEMGVESAAPAAAGPIAAHNARKL